MTTEAIAQRLAEIVRDRKWIVAVDVAAAATKLVEQLQGWGAADVLVVSSTEGIGDLPECRVVYTRSWGPTLIEGVRAFEVSIVRPNAAVAAAVHSFDPEGSARVLLSPFSALTSALERSAYGPRPLAQSALEDKMLADDIWDGAGIDRSPMEIVACRDAVTAAGRLDRGRGTVWVADNREGWHGGGAYVRWVRTVGDAADALEWYRARADRVRVMPFLDGIPCSIHGWVTGNGVAVGRPMEMLILRRTDRTGFHYGGMGTFWDPHRDALDEMRSAARAVGEHLVRRVGYVGPYGVDGVLTEDGFRPTELNPRITAGHAIPGQDAGLATGMMMRACLAGDLDFDAAWFEETIVAAARSHRRGRVMASLGEAQPARAVPVRIDGSVVDEVEHGEHQAIVQTGTSPHGGVLIADLDAERVPTGPSVAPMAKAILDFAREAWALDIPPVAFAVDRFREARAGS